jgi:hypothetical protein
MRTYTNLGAKALTDLDPYPEVLLLGIANSARNRARLRQNNRNSQKQGNGGNIDHVAGDDAVVEDLGVDAAHAVEGRLLLLVAARRQRGARPRVDLCEPPAAAREHARLLRLLIVRRRGRVADDRLQGDVARLVVHVFAGATERLEALIRKAVG